MKPTPINPAEHICPDFWLRAENLKVLLQTIHDEPRQPRRSQWTVIRREKGTPFVPMLRASE